MGGEEGGVSSFLADHSRNVHNIVISLDYTEDYEFTITGRQVVEYLNITRAEQEGKVKINHKITCKVKTKLTASKKSWGR